MNQNSCDTMREKFDDARKAVFLDLLANGWRRGRACKKVGIHRSTFEKHLNTYPKFAEAVAQAEMDACEIIEEALFQNARGDPKRGIPGNVTAQQVYLYNRCPERWADRRNPSVVIKEKSGLDEIREALRRGVATTTTEQ